MKRIAICLVLFSMLLMACTDTVDDKTIVGTGASGDPVLMTKNVKDLEPSLWEADSLQVIYYDDPGGDSLRYTRFFSYTETADTSTVNSLLQEMRQAYLQQDKMKNCRSEGKLFMLKGEDILKTIYFSTRKDSCGSFYFIKDGAFIYFPLTEKAATFLKENKARARRSLPAS